MNRLNNLIGLKNNRKDLRKHLTPAEAKLWSYIKSCQLGYKFRRQHSFNYYILDFYCPEKKLAIELDGSPHDTEEGFLKDKERTEYLQGQGIKVLRFENKDVIKNLEGVLLEIKKYLRNEQYCGASYPDKGRWIAKQDGLSDEALAKLEGVGL